MKVKTTSILCDICGKDVYINSSIYGEEPLRIKVNRSRELKIFGGYKRIDICGLCAGEIVMKSITERRRRKENDHT